MYTPRPNKAKSRGEGTYILSSFFSRMVAIGSGHQRLSHNTSAVTNFVSNSSARSIFRLARSSSCAGAGLGNCGRQRDSYCAGLHTSGIKADRPVIKHLSLSNSHSSLYRHVPVGLLGEANSNRLRKRKHPATIPNYNEGQTTKRLN